MKILLIILLISGGNVCFGQAIMAWKNTKWHSKISPHFKIYHESDWAPSSIRLELEKIHGRMRMNMAMFAPWMRRKKAKIYIYSTHESYVSGEFSPPSWSKGIACFQKKLIAVYDPGDMENLRAVITHELTHLFFESFYGEVAKYPPLWLNEGLAVLMEDSSWGDSGPWDMALKYMSKERIIHFEDFFKTNVDQKSSKQEIGDWYLQAYAIVKFLYPSGKRLQFRNFCYLLRDGVEIKKALWEAYRFQSIQSMENSWFRWHNETYKKSYRIRSASPRFIPIKSFFTP